MKEIAQTKSVLIVDECRKTGSWSEALVTMMVERCEILPRIRVLAADDCFIPLGKAATAGLPSKKDIVTGALELTGNNPTGGRQWQ